MYLWFMSLSYADCPNEKEEFVSKLHMQIANICAKNILYKSHPSNYGN